LTSHLNRTSYIYHPILIIHFRKIPPVDIPARKVFLEAIVIMAVLCPVFALGIKSISYNVESWHRDLLPD
jgi:hypothetical protein